jgi:hypothetical protein
MTAPMKFLGLGIEHPDRHNPTPSHTVLRLTTPAGALREVHLSEAQLESLAADATRAIATLGRIRRDKFAAGDDV